MLEEYVRTETYYYKNKKIYSTADDRVFSEEKHKISAVEPQTATLLLTWDNVEEATRQLNCPFYVRQRKQGKVLRSYLDVDCSLKLVQWRDDLDITVQITYRKLDLKLKDIINTWPAEQAIQYFKERGLAVCPLSEIDNK